MDGSNRATSPIGRADVGAAAEDPRFSPQWYFFGLGGLVALALTLIRINFLFLLIPLVGLIGWILARRRDGHLVYDPKSVIALHSPLPGTVTPVVVAVMLVNVSASVIVGPLLPVNVLPFWAVVVIACAVGAAVTLLARRSELMRIAGTRRLENREG